MAEVRHRVSLNGRVLCTSGIEGECGVLSVSLHWVKGPPRRLDGDVPGSAEVVEDHLLGVHGLDTATRTHLRWCGGELPLQPGDEVIIRILGPGEADAPTVVK